MRAILCPAYDGCSKQIVIHFLFFLVVNDVRGRIGQGATAGDRRLQREGVPRPAYFSSVAAFGQEDLFVLSNVPAAARIGLYFVCRLPIGACEIRGPIGMAFFRLQEVRPLQRFY